MKWQVKFLKNATIGILPLVLQENLRKIKRILLPHDVQLDIWTLRQGLQQIEMLRISGFEPSGKDYLEIGTGWSPIIPLIFALAGCRSLTLVDSQRLMDNHTFKETCRKLLMHNEEISQKLHIDIAYTEKKLTKLASMNLKDALTELNCTYMAPNNFLNNNFSDQSFDIVTSRAVLEHIPPKTIIDLFREFYRILRQSGAMCHIIDNSDHWEHHDKSITRLNYLKYSHRIFDVFSSMNPLDYQNRLRHSQYKKMIEESGFAMIYDDSHPDSQALQDLKSLKIHESFAQFSKNDLAVLTSYFVASK